MLDESARRERAIEHAGFNVLNLDGADLRVDLFTDVPPRVLVPALPDTQFSDTLDREPPVEELAEQLYGRRCFAMIKGRSAEVAAIQALGRRGGVVVGHPLFMTLDHALTEIGATYEVAPTRDVISSDLDLAWLDERLARGDVWMVCVEAATNGLGGRPLRLANLEGIRDRCRAHGVLLLLDATRLLTNCHLLGLPLVEAARMYAAIPDILTISAAKELLVPHAGLLACSDDTLAKNAYGIGRWHGTLLEPLALRRELARGIERVLHEPAIITERVRQVARMTNALAASGVRVLEPTAGHAAYVVLDDAIVAGGGARWRALESHLYLLTGIRTMVSKYAAQRCHAFRLALAVGRYSDEVIDSVAPAMRTFFDRLADAPELVEAPHRELRVSRVRYARKEPAAC
ncbi:MAG TPA: beta-eliminating lyase-related protein [Kofleriaceae bacterium]|nr:beta-eliminating lyase-related protein [Kofleriaceae bacterium]